MKLYRNHYHCEGGCSAGYEWFTSKQAATAAANKRDRALAVDVDQDYNIEADHTDPVAEPITISAAPNRDEILHLLNSYATHADNG